VGYAAATGGVIRGSIFAHHRRYVCCAIRCIINAWAALPPKHL
jgi:hypothetical protein